MGGEVVKDLIERYQTMRIEPKDAPNNSYAIQAHERAIRMLEQHKALTNAQRDKLHTETIQLKDLIRPQN